MKDLILVLGFFGIVGTFIWVTAWAISASVDDDEDRARDLRMVWLTPVWPIVLLALGAMAVPALASWVAECWRTAWPKAEEPEVRIVEGGRILKFHGIYTEAQIEALKARLATGEPHFLREDPEPGRWEQPR